MLSDERGHLLRAFKALAALWVEEMEFRSCVTAPDEIWEATKDEQPECALCAQDVECHERGHPVDGGGYHACTSRAWKGGQDGV
jgi:hypothetical protein